MLRYRYAIPARGALPLKKTKTLRRRCEAEACGKLYRHADPRSRACSPRCKQRLYRARKKAADLAEQERLEAERQDQASDIAARMLAAMKTAPAPGPTRPTRPTHQPQPTAPAPPRYLPARPPVEREEVVITIRQPTTFPGTPIRRGWYWPDLSQ